jgi:transcriptional regulator with XRE-family HTH domain
VSEAVLGPAVSERIVQARRKAGLSQRRFAERLGMSLWLFDQLERGRRDAAPHLPAIARAAGLDAAALGIAARQHEAPEAKASHGVIPARGVRIASVASGSHLVLGSIAILVLVRFFSEVVHVFPKAATFVDIPIFLVLVIAASARPHDARQERKLAPSFFVPAFLFFCLCVVSAILNISRVAPAPAIVFLYNFLSPLGIYFAVYRLWPVGNALSFSRLLVALGVVELIVVGVFDLPRFASNGNPDYISGTFGDNAYQLVFFLLLLTALLAGIRAFEPKRSAARIAPAMFVGIALTIFLAQYRALLVTTIISVIVIAGFLTTAHSRGLVIGSFLVMAFVVALSFVAANYPTTKLGQTVQTLRSDPSLFVKARLGAAGDVVDLFSNTPRFMLTGTGPATFSSRAWRTFSDLQVRRTTVAAPYVAKLNGGPYRTDVSDRYVVPRLESAAVIQGSHAPTSPFSSYLALAAEVGLPGLVLLIGMYAAGLIKAGRLTLIALRDRLPGDPVPALLLACTVAFSILLQLAALENWLEVTRITFLSWALLAIGAKELEARRKEPADR